MPLPDPNTAYPITLPDGTVHKGTVLLRTVIDTPNFEVGAYTYASDFTAPANWAQHLAPYLFPFSQEKLVIGKFCQIAHGVRFLTASANHATDGLSCYPFPIFATETRAGFQPDTRDTVIGNDVWIGHGAMILPGAQIGDGAIIGAGAVVRGTIPAYGIETGNPATVARHRFDPATIDRLLKLAWWDWNWDTGDCPPDRLAFAQQAIQRGDLDQLEALIL